MSTSIDETDRAILSILQKDATLRIDALADRVGRSRNACWRRVRAMEDAGVIAGRVALLDPGKIGCPLEVIVLLRTSSHEPDWMERFQALARGMPEIVGAYRMTGDIDYMLRVRVADVPAYDRFYKRLTAKMPLSDISASFVMEQIKETTALPL